jgi:biopolymer transport protein ExbB
METVWIEFQAYMAEGGFVMPPLVLLACALWYGLGERMLLLRRGMRGDMGLVWSSGVRPSKGVLGDAWSQVSKTELKLEDKADTEAAFEEVIHPIRRSLNKHRVLVKSVVIIAPLAGLLGTVSGMIETFDSLGDRTLFAASGGVAGGISQALLTTQMGLVVAIPGVIAGRLLDRKQNSLEDDLDQMVALATLQRNEVSP